MDDHQAENTPVSQGGAAGLVWTALGLGVWFGFIIVGYALGIAAPLWVGLILGALVWQAWRARRNLVWANIWLVAGILFFSSMLAVRTAGAETFFNVMASISLALLLAHALFQVDLRTYRLGNYFISAIITSLEVLLMRQPDVLASAWAQGRRQDSRSGALGGVLRGLVLALPVVIFFALLLSSADVVFEKVVQNWLHLLRLDNLPELLGRILAACLAGWVILGGLAYALRPLKTAEADPNATGGRKPLGFTEASVVLGSVDALFAVFVGIQFQYFFGGQSNINLDGFTYAEYARRGFAELVVVALFSLGLGLLLQAVTRVEGRMARVSFVALAGLLAALTGVMLVSAFQRLGLYEQAYGFTQLRLYVHVFMLWLGVLLGIYLLTLLVSRPHWFIFSTVLACVGFGITLNLLNTDALIVRLNLARYFENGALDAQYLATLSDDAVPDLLLAFERLDLPEQEVIGSGLHLRLLELDESMPEAHWGSWNWARSRAYRLLQQARPVLEPYPPQKYYWEFPLD